MTILPGQTIGILGGGQLGRMFAIAARRMGYRVHALDPTPESPTGQVADYEVTARYDDLDAARRFAFGVDVVTFEFENVPAETLAAIEEIRPVFPSPFVLQTTRHRLREKEFLAKNGFPVAPFRRVDSVDSLRGAIAGLGTPSILKTAEFGYDGKGQSIIRDPSEVDRAWNELRAPVGVLEGFVKFDCEISVVGGRGEDRLFHAFPPVENVHRNHILDVTTYPARISAGVSKRAIEMAQEIAAKLDLRGVMCVEMFVVGNEVLVNEIAPRPHNSGHLTIDAFTISQFEMQLRAVCGLPMTASVPLAPAAAMVNLLGDLWHDRTPNWPAALRDSSVKLHLYGKQTARPGRKMGHITATDDSLERARAAAMSARDALTQAAI